MKEVVLDRVIAQMELLYDVVAAQAFGNLPHHHLLSFAQKVGALALTSRTVVSLDLSALR